MTAEPTRPASAALDGVLAVDASITHLRELRHVLLRLADPEGRENTELNAYRARLRHELRAPVLTTDEGLDETIGLAVGAASACWSNLRGAGVFDDQHARVIVEVLAEIVRDYAWHPAS